LPEEHHGLIDDALECYRSGAPVSVADRKTHGHDWEHETLEMFRIFTAGRLGGSEP
jgi:hypothetical protein